MSYRDLKLVTDAAVAVVVGSRALDLPLRSVNGNPRIVADTDRGTLVIVDVGSIRRLEQALIDVGAIEEPDPDVIDPRRS